jgi:hypothetical protein
MPLTAADQTLASMENDLQGLGFKARRLGGKVCPMSLIGRRVGPIADCGVGIASVVGAAAGLEAGDIHDQYCKRDLARPVDAIEG